VLAFDIGGTWVKHGLVDAHGRVHAAGRLPTRPAGDGAALLAQLEEVARPLVHWHDPAGIAVATLGVVDAADGRVRAAGEAIRGYTGLSPRAVFERAFGRPVVVENDGNSVALAEGWTGAAAGVRDYLAITLGTGIGGGVVVDGRLHRGRHGAAGEWGYMRVADLLWEDHASLRGLAAAAARARSGGALDARAVFEASDAGDPVMRDVVARWFDLLATGMANLLFAFDPARVVIGGGITARGGVFLDELSDALRPRLGPEFHGQADLALAAAGNHAGLIGAARLWFDRHAPGAVDAAAASAAIAVTFDAAAPHAR
jgi:predicted NBD/HSP70 family sugar kinase